MRDVSRLVLRMNGSWTPTSTDEEEERDVNECIREGEDGDQGHASADADGDVGHGLSWIMVEHTSLAGQC